MQVDIVFEVRDARILTSTRHPQLDEWTNNKTRILVVNRVDQVNKQDVKIWKAHFTAEGRQAFFTNGKLGDGTDKLQRAAASMSKKVNASRVRRGLKPRPVRACVMGFPNIGKSAIINRLLNRRVVQSAAKPGVTRGLRWIRMGEDLDLLDAPGIIPMSMGVPPRAFHIHSHLPRPWAGGPVARVRPDSRPTAAASLSCVVHTAAAAWSCLALCP